MCECVFVYMCAYMCTYLWRSEVDTACLLLLHSILFLRLCLSLSPEHTTWLHWLASGLWESSWFCPFRDRVIDKCQHTWLLCAEDLDSGPPVWKAGTSWLSYFLSPWTEKIYSCIWLHACTEIWRQPVWHFQKHHLPPSREDLSIKLTN